MAFRFDLSRDNVIGMHDVEGKRGDGKVTFLPASEPASHRANIAKRQKEETH